MNRKGMPAVGLGDGLSVDSERLAISEIDKVDTSIWIKFIVNDLIK